MEPNQIQAQPPVAAPAAPAAEPTDKLKLPVLVFGVAEVRRLGRELESLDEFIQQANLREPGKQPALPRLSRLLDALAAENRLNLLQPADRARLQEYLKHVEHDAPTVHMSFATDPSSAFTAKMVGWMRANVAPDLLLEVGLQPTIAAGSIVRTKNKIFDLSLRERLADAHSLLLESLEQPLEAAPALPVGVEMGVVPAAAATPPAPAAAVPTATPQTPNGMAA